MGKNRHKKDESFQKKSPETRRGRRYRRAGRRKGMLSDGAADERDALRCGQGHRADGQPGGAAHNESRGRGRGRTSSGPKIQASAGAS